MPWQLYLSECDEELVTYNLPNGRTLLAHRDRVHQRYPNGLNAVQVKDSNVELKIGVQSDRLIVFIDLHRQGGQNVFIADFRKPDSFRSLAALRQHQIESTDCFAVLTALGAPGIAVQIKDRPGHYFALKWWNTDLGPYPTPVESPSPPPTVQ